jgi:hypothetical protein
VDLPDGELVIIDPGLANFWRHAGNPASPLRRDPPCVDLLISGADAKVAGTTWDREFNPLAIYDAPKPDTLIAQFADFTKRHGFDASASVSSRRIPHTERLKAALQVGAGLGVVTYNPLWCAVVGGFRRDSSLEVTATLMPAGDFANRLKTIDIVALPDAEVVRTDRVDGVMVDHGQLIEVDPVFRTTPRFGNRDSSVMEGAAHGQEESEEVRPGV